MTEYAAVPTREETLALDIESEISRDLPEDWTAVRIVWQPRKGTYYFAVYADVSNKYYAEKEGVPVEALIRLDWELAADSGMMSKDYLIPLMQEQIQYDLDSGDILGYTVFRPKESIR